MPKHLLSLLEASKAVGKSKPTIHRAVQSGKVSAERDKDNRSWIDPAELSRVYTDEFDQGKLPERMRNDTQRSDTPKTVSVKQSETPETSQMKHLEIPFLRRELEDLKERLQEMRHDHKDERDRFTKEIEFLRERVVASEAQSAGMTKLLEDRRSRDQAPKKRGIFGLIG